VYLNKINYVNGIISEDSDILALGGKILLRKIDFQNMIAIEIRRNDIFLMK